MPRTGAVPAAGWAAPSGGPRLADTVAPGAEASVQRPRPGHKGSPLCVLGQGLESRWPGLCDLKPEQCVKLPSAFLAALEGSQHSLLGTGVWVLLGRCEPLGCAGAAPALRGRDLNCHRGPGSWGPPGSRGPALPVPFLGAGKILPQDGFQGLLGFKVPPRLGDRPPRWGPSPLASGEGLGPDKASRALGRASGGCGLRCAQGAAHARRVRRGCPQEGFNFQKFPRWSDWPQERDPGLR